MSGESYDVLPTSWIWAISKQFNIHILNTAPEFISQPDSIAHPTDNYQYQITAEDKDGDQVYFIGSNIPDWLTLTDNENGIIMIEGIRTNVLLSVHIKAAAIFQKNREMVAEKAILPKSMESYYKKLQNL